MKKLFYLLFISFALASCNKEYECTCDHTFTYSDSSAANQAASIHSSPLVDQETVTAKSKKKAEEECNSLDYVNVELDSMTDLGGNPLYYYTRTDNYNCELE